MCLFSKSEETQGQNQEFKRLHFVFGKHYGRVSVILFSALSALVWDRHFPGHKSVTVYTVWMLQAGQCPSSSNRYQ